VIIYYLRNGDWVSLRAVRGTKTTSVRVSDMTPMVRRIKVDTIPARGEDDSGTNALGAVLGWQLTRVLRVAGSEAFPVTETAVTDGCLVVVLPVRGISGKHTEARLESGHLVVDGAVWHVIYCHSAVLLKPYVGHLRDALECTVLGRAEVQRGCPVVAEVLSELC
jgi:hypothetical protein